MKKTIELEWEQVDAIVVSELQATYEHCRTDGFEKRAEENSALMKAIEIVLGHYMPQDDLIRWKHDNVG